MLQLGGLGLTTKATTEAIELLKESLKELESQKGSILTAVQKLSRVSKIIDNNDIYVWCEIQLGNEDYTFPLKQYKDALIKSFENETDEVTKSNFKKAKTELDNLGLTGDIHYPFEEIKVKLYQSGGEYLNIGFIEETYADLIRTKKGNDGTYYKNPLYNHLSYIRKSAHNKISLLYNKLAYANTPQTSFDILKTEIDDKLFDLNPELAEQLMLAFKGVVTNNPEEWSHSLTTCRRFLKKLADILFPPRVEKVNGRSVGEEQYINRIWLFMDNAIESKSNSALAKAHVDFLGSYLQSLYNVSCKGVHAELNQIEALKAVFHTYLMVADILKYLQKESTKIDNKLNIYTASLDELESVLGVNRTIAKEIIKLRVNHGIINKELLLTIKGVGAKTVSNAEEVLSFEPIK